MDDSGIIALFQERSERAVAELETKYGAAVRKTAANILSDKQDVEECVNDAWLAVWNSIPPQEPKPLVTYVCRIARNLAGLGWEVDPYSEETRSVRIQDCSEGVMAEYNRLQQSQGFDLSGHEGERCEQFSYVVTNYPGYEETVYATLYLQKGRLIAGDIHTAAVNGFMHALVRAPSAAE